MSIWTFNRRLLLLAGLALAGCEQTGEFGFLASGAQPASSNALRAVSMLDGNVVLAAPAGYCIDKGSLRSAFALIARCDTLGSGRKAAGKPLVLITAALVPQGVDATAPKSQDLATVFEAENVLQAVDRKGVALVQTNSATGLDGMSKQHWRGAFEVNGVLVGLALYAPEGSDAVGKSGATILTALADRTRAQSRTRVAATNTSQTPATPGNTD